MAVGNAEDIFERFRGFRTNGGSGTPEEQFDRYCKETLSPVEKHHFDYKTKHDSRNSNLDEADKKNLAKAISGFANTGGGVLLWGINEGPPLKLQSIAGVEAFLKRLLDLAGQATDPRVQGIDGEWLPSNADPTAGYAAIFIPESQLPPHRVILKLQDVQHHYFVRTASNFDITSHAYLEGLFGRRPQPKLVPVVKEDFSYGKNLDGWTVFFDILNEGRGTAKHVCIEFPWQDGLSCFVTSVWTHLPGSYDKKTEHQSLLFELPATRVVHPGMAIGFWELHLSRSAFRPEDPVALACTIYCEGCAPTSHVIKGKLKPIWS